MANTDNQGTITLQELVVSSLAQTDALCKVLIQKGLITKAEFMEKLKEEMTSYQVMLQRTEMI